MGFHKRRILSSVLLRTHQQGGWSATQRLVTTPDALMVTTRPTLAQEFMERWSALADDPNPEQGLEQLNEFISAHVRIWETAVAEAKSIAQSSELVKSDHHEYYSERLRHLDKILSYYSD